MQRELKRRSCEIDPCVDCAISSTSAKHSPVVLESEGMLELYAVTISTRGDGYELYWRKHDRQTRNYRATGMDQQLWVAEEMLRLPRPWSGTIHTLWFMSGSLEDLMRSVQLLPRYDDTRAVTIQPAELNVKKFATGLDSVKSLE